MIFVELNCLIFFKGDPSSKNEYLLYRNFDGALPAKSTILLEFHLNTALAAIVAS